MVLRIHVPVGCPPILFNSDCFSFPVDREHVTVWPLFILQPDIMTGAIGFTKKAIRLQHFIAGNF